MSATPDTQSLRDDLAFLRSLAQPTESGQRAFGEGYFVGGVCYGGQLVLDVAQSLGLIPNTGLVTLLTGVGPTVVFVGLLSWVIWRHRGQPAGGGVMNRAVGNLFGILGLANVALAAVIGWVAWREHNFTTWLIYPCCVFILQGAAWLVALTLRRKRWYGLVAIGWIVSGLGMTLAIWNMPAYTALAAVGLVLCMALPGWVMMRGAGQVAKA